MLTEFAATSLEKMHVEADKGFRELLKSGRLMALPYKVVIQEGSLWPAIEELIKKFDIDLLVVGARGIGAARKVLLGSGARQRWPPKENQIDRCRAADDRLVWVTEITGFKLNFSFDQ
jgi:hypothetical protein